ncbi:MAG: MFS transporter [Planctomycetota bacterium]|nr:MFS transporter [Planctomycetota bacterium]
MTNAATNSLDIEITGSQALSKIHSRLLPFLCLLFIVNYLDRTNVAMAKLTMLADAHLTNATYGLGAGLFFIGYFFFEVPSNLILHRVGARRWIARIMITWGLCSAAMFLTRGPRSFYALRFLLGLAEAGFFPGIVFYLTYWIPVRQRARALALFLTATAISGAIGNPLAGLLLKLDGLAGLHGWQWLFILEGVPPIVLGILILSSSALPDCPADAAWLSAEQVKWIEDELAREGEHPRASHVADLRAAADGRLALLSMIYFLLIMGLYGIVYWVPSIVKSMTGSSNAMVGLMSALPFVIGAVTMVAIGAHADRTDERRWHVAVCALTGAIGIAALAASTGTAVGMTALCVAAVGIFGTLGPFWAIPTRYLRGTAAAGGLAVINSIGALSGFVAPYAIGYAKDRTGSYAAGLLVVAVSLALGSMLVLCVPRETDER